MNNKNPKVDQYLSEKKKWREELTVLRSFLLDCPLQEEFKWRSPCYTSHNSNVVLISGFKEYCVLSFFKGSLLKDPGKVLAKPGENSQAARIIKFTSVQEVAEMETLIKDYIHDAIEVEKAGLKVDFKKSTELVFPEELQKILNTDQKLKDAFEALTPGRQRAYNLYFSAPKQPKTREARIEKCIQRILDGKGINDCTCGLTKKKPVCDGSHKYAKQST